MKKFNFHRRAGDEGYLYQPIEITGDELLSLPKGIYRIQNTIPLGFVPMFVPVPRKEELIRFRHGIMEEVMKKTDRFLSKEVRDKYLEMKIVHKLGMLIYGTPGTGKTCLSMLIMEEMASKYGAICLVGTGMHLAYILQSMNMIRAANPNDPIVIFVDEVEQSMKDHEYSYLPYLDGGDSIDNSIFIGVTNRIEQVPDRIKERKSRIKYKFEVKGLPSQVYEQYILEKVPSMKGKALAELVYKSGEACLTIDQLKHVLIDYRIDGINVTNSIKEVLKEAGKTIEFADDDVDEDDWIDDEDEDSKNSRL